MYRGKNEHRLAAHLKKLAQGAGYRDRAEELKEKEKRQQLREVEFGEGEFRQSPYRNNANLTQLSEWRAKVGDTIADIHKAEVETPVKLPWIGERNLSFMMAMQRADPHLRTLVDRSISRLRELAGEELNESQ